jgi:ribonuclease HI
MSGARASIFCDGACRGNGTRRAVAGWAWAFWPGVARGEPTASGAARLDAPATNQRAELMALLEALRFVQRGGGGGKPVTIYTDSQYTIKCTTVWGPGWKKKGWTRGSGEPLQNLDIIKPLVDLWGTLRVPLVHVRGHQTGSSPEAWGNNWVDRAAVVAAGGEGEDMCRPATAFASASTSAGIEMFTAAALEETTDAIEHIVGGASTPIYSPSPRPSATKKPAPTVGTVKQMDIRAWFGGGTA